MPLAAPVTTATLSLNSFMAPPRLFSCESEAVAIHRGGGQEPNAQRSGPRPLVSGSCANSGRQGKSLSPLDTFHAQDEPARVGPTTPKQNGGCSRSLEDKSALMVP